MTSLAFPDFLEVFLRPAKSEARDQEQERDRRQVEAARKDPAAFSDLVRRHQGRVFSTSLRFLGSAAEAEDVAQEAFLKAFQNLHRFDVSRRFAPWVCTIAANLARDRLRKPSRRLRAFFQPSAREEPRVEVDERGIAQREAQDELADRLQAIAPKLREAIVLRYIAELSVEEVADALGLSVSATKMRLKRGLDQLKEGD